MQAIAVSNGYTSGKVYVIWEIPHNDITGYEIICNGVVIASSFTEEPSEFINPTMFDHDHQTNLFKKDSHFKLMYIDENVHRYQEYEYKVIARRINEDGNVMEEITSDSIFITAQ